MAEFPFIFRRRVEVTEFVTRNIEAPDAITAKQLAESMASEFNHSCPDDAQESGEGGFECSDWEPELESEGGQFLPVTGKLS